MHLHFRAYGSGPPLVILHGLFGSLDNWVTLARRFGERWTVFALDARDHGRSPHDDRFDYDAMAEDVRDFLVRENIPSASIIGHSMGGKTAMQCAIRYPDIVDRLVVVDIMPGAYPRGHDRIFEALRSVPLDTLASRAEAEPYMLPFVPEPAVRQFLLKNLQRTDAGGFAWKFHLEAIARQYDLINGALSLDGVSFRKPVLFLRGGRSRYVPPELPSEVLLHFPLAVLQTIPQAGHWVHADAPEEFYRMVAEFL